MRIVALPGEVFETRLVAKLHADPIVDEAGDDLPLEDVTGLEVAEVLKGPAVVVRVDVVDALQEVGALSRPQIPTVPGRDTVSSSGTEN